MLIVRTASYALRQDGAHQIVSIQLDRPEYPPRVGLWFDANEHERVAASKTAVAALDTGDPATGAPVITSAADSERGRRAGIADPDGHPLS